MGSGFYKVPQEGSGTPRPKTISARDSSAQIDFFTGTPRPGTPRPSYKNIFLWNTMENKCISNVLLFQYKINLYRQKKC